jgi:hypothetical protein
LPDLAIHIRQRDDIRRRLIGHVVDDDLAVGNRPEIAVLIEDQTGRLGNDAVVG